MSYLVFVSLLIYSDSLHSSLIAASNADGISADRHCDCATKQCVLCVREK